LIVEPRGVHNVMQMDDDTFTSHPVYVHVDNPDEINRIFDLISYAKVIIVKRLSFLLFRRQLSLSFVEHVDVVVRMILLLELSKHAH
jgi:aminopeptidase N